jgi:hypothetical protein
MDALYQIRAHRSETDLAIDQLRETLALLAAERAPGIGKLEKRLDEVGRPPCCIAAEVETAEGRALRQWGAVLPPCSAYRCPLRMSTHRFSAQRPDPTVTQPFIDGGTLGWHQEGPAAGQEQLGAHPGGCRGLSICVQQSRGPASLDWV